jgi:hypothetical protein
LGNAALSLGIVAFRAMTTSPRLELIWSDAVGDIGMLSAYRLVLACVKTGSTWAYLHPMRSDLRVLRLIVPSPGIFTFTA